MNPSILTKSQTRTTKWKEYTEHGRRYRIRATVRHDDDCNNGHNSFAVTGEIEVARVGWQEDAGGCLHDEVEKHFPELAPLIKWHLMSTDGPMHYLTNTLYHVKTGRLDYARSTAVWPEATDAELMQDLETLKATLLARLPALLEAFRKDVEAFGFVY